MTRLRAFFRAGLGLCVLLGFCQAAVFGDIPPRPVFENIKVQANCTFDSSTQTYKYEYHVTNPPTNTIGVWLLSVTVGPELHDIGAVVVPRGKWDSDISPGGGIRFPKDPYINWVSYGQEWGDPYQALPGTTVGPFGFSASRPPAIRECWAEPWLSPYFEAYLRATGEESFPMEGPEGSEAIKDSYVRKIPTLGPLGVIPGSFEHWDTFLADVAKAGQLGWISDGGLLTTVQSNLLAARQAALAQDAATTNAKLQAVIDAMVAAPESQRTSEGYALVLLNAQYLQRDIPWPCEPKLVVSPVEATHALGETHTFAASLGNVANATPIANNPLLFEVTEGPHAGLVLEAQTDGEGKASVSYGGKAQGTDTVVVSTPCLTVAKKGAQGQSKTAKTVGKASAALSRCFADCLSAQVKVTWQGGPDLVVPLFLPPVLINAAPGKTFHVTEVTRNVGSLPAPPSVTRYFIAPKGALDPSTAVVLGERQVPALAPGEKSEVPDLSFVVPSSLPPGMYSLDACADAPKVIAEIHETNNCASSSLRLIAGFMPKNQPPQCAAAKASPSLLWPPDHRLVSITLTGVSEPEGEPLKITVTSITQDEPPSGLGSGDTCPDALGVGTDQVQLRAERSEQGNGRVYRISFTAEDQSGRSCCGTVTVWVPRGSNETPQDDGQAYDASKCR